MVATYRQEIAPPGGYKDFQWGRQFTKSINGWKIIGVMLGIKALAFTYWIKIARPGVRLQFYEEVDSKLAIMPFYTAERDRLNIKQFRAMRDEEAELMKNDPNWKVGTANGHKVYIKEQNKFNEMMVRERYVFETKPNNAADKLKVAVGITQFEL